MQITTKRDITFEFETPTCDLVVLTPEEAIDLRDSLDKALKASGFIPTPAAQPDRIEPAANSPFARLFEEAGERQSVIEKAERQLAVEKLIREQREQMERWALSEPAQPRACFLGFSV